MQAAEGRNQDLIEALRNERAKQAELAQSMQTLASEAKVAEAETRVRLTASVDALQTAL